MTERLLRNRQVCRLVGWLINRWIFSPWRVAIYELGRADGVTEAREAYRPVIHDQVRRAFRAGYSSARAGEAPLPDEDERLRKRREAARWN